MMRKMTSVEFKKLIKPKPFKPSEKQIERNILEYLETIGICAWKQNNGALVVGNRFIKFFMDSKGNTIKGMPDIAGYLKDGRALYIEVKSEKGRLTPEQKNFITNAQESNCVAFVARSIKDVERNLKKFNAI